MFLQQKINQEEIVLYLLPLLIALLIAGVCGYYLWTRVIEPFSNKEINRFNHSEENVDEPTQTEDTFDEPGRRSKR